MLCCVLLLLCSTLCGVTCYPQFRSEIPNGLFVPHPCRPSAIWRGVGHKNVLGGGARNPFGVDFNDNGRVWDATLCMKDSDGDGKTNGEELGDPDCTWTVGQKLTGSVTLSHPGVCEPLNSSLCEGLNDWEIDCEDPEFVCDAIEREDVFSVTYNFPRLLVPAKDTTYMCMSFALPSDKDYHIVAAEPFIDNINVMHHLLAYGVNAETGAATIPGFAAPRECTMGTFDAPAVMIWSIGLRGYCMSEEAGIRVGNSSYTHMLLEIHWSNTFLRDDYVDGSGLTVYFTPKLKPYDAAILFVSPTFIELPFGQAAVSLDAECSGVCMDKIFPEAAFIDTAYPHMHYLGRAFRSELKRNGQVIAVLLDSNQYNYDSAAVTRFDPPIRIEPGDVITVTCTWETLNQDKIVFFGDASLDEEMCAVILSYYPKHSELGYCTGQGSEKIGQCGDIVNAQQHAACLQQMFGLLFGPPTEVAEWFKIVSKVCDPTGRACYPGCTDAVAKVKSHACFQGDFHLILKSALVRFKVLPHSFLFMLESCTFAGK